MGKLKGRRPSPALLVAVVALVAALGGGAVAGVAVTTLNKKEKKQVKKIAKKQANKAVKGIPAGPPGPKGQDATKLFAYIHDTGSGSEAEVEYGSGVTGVSDSSGNNSYLVTFNRSMVGCVVDATVGIGNPKGAPITVPLSGQLSSFVAMDSGADNEVGVSVTTEGSVVDHPFMVTAFC